jgi:hypothetical protein
VTVLETERLTIRRLTVDDAPFILRLLNENVASINLLVKLGFYFDRMVLMPGDTEELRLFARNFGEDRP